MKRITANLDYMVGHLRYGHLELELTDEQYEEFKKLSKEEQEEWLRDDGARIADDYEIDDIGSIYHIKVKDA
jgi:hypothetical protein